MAARDRPYGLVACKEFWFIEFSLLRGSLSADFSLVLSCTLSEALLYIGPDDHYTRQNENPDLQPNHSAQSDKQPLPTLPYLIFK